ncbi:MAG TPA: A/G-specific adenine glycosylase, partial [Anseongella sp.]|nr:A/G-specific adenine glycosylase [Anseongella sp.]
IILQQTRVDQGLPYYYRFASAFPSVTDLAAASEDQVMKLWQGLGYYSRARNMHATAKQVSAEPGAHFPTAYSSLIRLKGIGEYTAAAIASFAGNEARAVVDGNVYRVLSRYFGVDLPIDSSAGKKYFAGLAQELLDEADPGLHNQAMMEFGAVQCRPLRPGCGECPLNAGCAALKENKVGLLPVKSKKTLVRKRYLNYLVIRNQGKLWLNRRESGDIWQSLYDFPLVETSGPVEEAELLLLEGFKKILNKADFLVISVSETFRHILSHQVIYARFWELELQGYHAPENYIAAHEGEMEAYAFPRLITGYLENNL